MAFSMPFGFSIALLSGLQPLAAHAASCEASIVKRGTFFEGARYEVQVEIPQMSVATAFQQLRSIYQISKIRILSEDKAGGMMKAELGATLFEQAIPITISASGQATSNRLRMAYDVRPGEVVGGGWVRRHMCSVLAQIRAMVPSIQPPSSQTARSALTRPPPPSLLTGQNLVKPVSATAPSPAVSATIIETSTLAAQVIQARSNPARLDANFIGRTFRVSGLVSNIAIRSGGYAVWFEGEPQKGSEEEQWQNPSLAIKCLVSRTEVQAAAALSMGSRGTLTGRFSKLDDDPRAPAVILENCSMP